MCEDDAETTATLVSFTVIQTSLIAFAELSGNIEAQARTLVLCREKRLEDILHLLDRHARTVIKHFEDWQIAGLVAEVL